MDNSFFMHLSCKIRILNGRNKYIFRICKYNGKFIFLATLLFAIEEDKEFSYVPHGLIFQ